MTAVLTAGHWRTNADMMAEVLPLHLPTDSTVLDATYGKGNFWTVDMLHRYTVNTNDLHAPGAYYHYDYREFPAKWLHGFDAVIFDPPYVVRGGRSTDTTYRAMNEAYGLRDAPTSVAGLAEMNHAGLTECARVTRPGGWVFVKYADAVSSGRKHWQIDGINNHALSIGLTKVDQFLFVTRAARAQPPRTRKDGQPSRQHHGRNNTSVLTVYRKPASPRQHGVNPNHNQESSNQ